MKHFPHLGVAAALAFASTTICFGQATGLGATHKLEMRDPVAEQQLLAHGGRLIGDYGGFRLYEAAQVPQTGTVRDDYNTIQLNAKPLNTRAPETRALQTNAGNFAGKRLHLVQFAGPPLPQWRESILATGARIVSYVPENAYLVYGDAKAIGGVQQFAAANPQVQWHGEYRDDYKIHPAARFSKTGKFAIQLVNDAAENAETLKLLNSLRLAPLDRQGAVLEYINVIGTFAKGDLAKIAAQPDVVSIQPYGERQKFCERQDQIIAGAVTNGALTGPGYLGWLKSKGFSQDEFNSAGFAVDVSDSGIDDGTTTPHHFGFYEEGNTEAGSRVAYNKLFGTPNPGSTIVGCDGHGNLNAHIVAGYDDYAGFPFADGEGYHYGLGVCPFVRVGSSVVFDPIKFTSPNYTTLQSTAYHNGARISNNSWGGAGDFGSLGIYDADAQEYDALVRDAQPDGSPYAADGNQEMVIVFAAGNAGVNTNTLGTELGTIESPGSAKNVITVGASENVQPYNAVNDAPDNSGVYDFEADNADGLVDFSSRGPCQDGRHKPDLVAPGTHVSGGAPQAASPGADGTGLACFVSNNKSLESKNAGVSGGPINSRSFPFFPASQQFYTASSGTSHSTPCVSGACALLRQYFINQGSAAPSPAMTKAFLMNSARYLDGPNAGGSLWSDAQGMGELNLGTAFDGTPRFLRDEEAADLLTSTGQSRTFTGEVADPSQPFRVTVAWTDAPGNTFGKAYNNDLDLTVTVGGVKYLGNVFNGAYSTTGGNADTVNNVESVFLPAGTKGAYTVTVTAENINSVGVPNAANQINQDFALVIDNASAGQNPIIAAAGATVTTKDCQNNDVLSQGGQATVNFALQNVGGSATGNLVATLLPGNGVVEPSSPQTYGRLPAEGGAVTLPYSFYVDAACGEIVDAVLQLQDGATNLGTLDFPLNVGELAPATVLSQTFQGGIPSSWTTFSNVRKDDWTATNDGTAGTVAFAGDAGSTNEGILISPPIVISGDSPQLIFTHRYNLESPASGVGYDGGVLEIKIGQDKFQDILAAGGSFISNGYNSTIVAEGGNPLLAHLAWSRESGYVTTVANLPAAASGQTVQLEWICAADVLNDPMILHGAAGWWISNVVVTEQSPNCCANGQIAGATILSPVNGTQATSVTNSIIGTATPGDSVTLFDNSVSNTTLTADANGFFYGMVTLNYGTNILSVHQQPIHSSDSAPVNVFIGLPSPTLAAPSVSGEPIVVTGTQVPNASAEIYVDGGGFPESPNPDATGHFSLELYLSPGAHSLTVVQDFCPSISSCISSPTSAPVNVTVIGSQTPSITSPTNNFVTNGASLTIQGQSYNGSSVTLFDNGAPVSTITPTSGGVFAFTGVFPNGTNVLTAADTSGPVAGMPGVPVTAVVQLSPDFVVQPTPAIGFVEGTATFEATASGAGPLQYQWERNGEPIAGATHSILTISPITANSPADYQVVARNPYGVAISETASLTLVTNPFPALAGAYNGLVLQPPVYFSGAAFVNLSLTTLGAFSGKLTIGLPYSFAGRLSPTGAGSATINLKGEPPIQISLNLEMAQNPPEFSGTVAGVEYTLPLRATRAVYSASHPSPWRGKDTLTFGSGFGSVAVGANGYAALSGFLPDNSAVAPFAASVSAEGDWPFYAPLYGKAGALVGWLHFSGESATNISGALYWTHNDNTTNMLAEGAPLASAPFLGLTNLQIVLGGGDLTAPLTNTLTLQKSGALKPVDATVPGLALTVATSSGLVNGHFLNPATRVTEQIKGIVFQAQTNASGFFRDASGSGSFVITAEPEPLPHPDFVGRGNY